MGLFGFFKDTKDESSKPKEIPSSRVSALSPKDGANAIPTAVVEAGARTAGFSDTVRTSACFSKTPEDPCRAYNFAAAVNSAVSDAALAQMGVGCNLGPKQNSVKDLPDNGPLSANDWAALLKAQLE